MLSVGTEKTKWISGTKTCHNGHIYVLKKQNGVQVQKKIITGIFMYIYIHTKMGQSSYSLFKKRKEKL